MILAYPVSGLGTGQGYCKRNGVPTAFDPRSSWWSFPSSSAPVFLQRRLKLLETEEMYKDQTG